MVYFVFLFLVPLFFLPNLFAVRNLLRQTVFPFFISNYHETVKKKRKIQERFHFVKKVMFIFLIMSNISLKFVIYQRRSNCLLLEFCIWVLCDIQHILHCNSNLLFQIIFFSNFPMTHSSQILHIQLFSIITKFETPMNR